VRSSWQSSAQLTVPHGKPIMALASRNRIPTLVAVVPGTAFPDALMWYGPHLLDRPARAAHHVHRILKGARPSDLPIEQPNKCPLRTAGRRARAH
jgi:putative ABC transport system substrate-binding protein